MEREDLIIRKDQSINEWIDENISKYGANNFYYGLSNNYDEEIANSIIKSILNDIKKEIKPSQINTIEDLAKLLDGNEYRDELYNEYGINVYDLCEQNNWIIAYPQSDDLLEINGKFDEEFGAYDGTILKFVRKGDFYKIVDEDDTYKKAKEDQFVDIDENELHELKNISFANNLVIESIWMPEELVNEDASWQVKCFGAPSAKFKIMEDDSLYAECLVIDMNKFV